MGLTTGAGAGAGAGAGRGVGLGASGAGLEVRAGAASTDFDRAGVAGMTFGATFGAGAEAGACWNVCVARELSFDSDRAGFPLGGGSATRSLDLLLRLVSLLVSLLAGRADTPDDFELPPLALPPPEVFARLLLAGGRFESLSAFESPFDRLGFSPSRCASPDVGEEGP